MQQVHIYYSGMVQGVGFRFTVQGYAIELGLTGWVKNLPDGRVEVLVEGEEKSIRQFLDAIDKHFQLYIKNKEILFAKAQPKFNDFRIAH